AREVAEALAVGILALRRIALAGSRRDRPVRGRQGQAGRRRRRDREFQRVRDDGELVAAADRADVHHRRPLELVRVGDHRIGIAGVERQQRDPGADAVAARLCEIVRRARIADPILERERHGRSGQYLDWHHRDRRRLQHALARETEEHRAVGVKRLLRLVDDRTAVRRGEVQPTEEVRGREPVGRENWPAGAVFELEHQRERRRRRRERIERHRLRRVLEPERRRQRGVSGTLRPRARRHREDEHTGLRREQKAADAVQPVTRPSAHGPPLLWTWTRLPACDEKCPSRVQLIEYMYIRSVASLVWTLMPAACPSSCVMIERITCWNVAWGDAAESAVLSQTDSVVGSDTKGSSTHPSLFTSIAVMSLSNAPGTYTSPPGSPLTEHPPVCAEPLSAPLNDRSHTTVIGASIGLPPVGVGRKVPGMFSWCRYGRSLKYALMGLNSTSAAPY